jgi:hypothetical protein
MPICTYRVKSKPEAELVVIVNYHSELGKIHEIENFAEFEQAMRDKYGDQLIEVKEVHQCV